MFKSKVLSAAAAACLALLAGQASALTISAGDIKITIDNYDSGTVNYGNTSGVKCTTIAGCDAVPGITAAAAAGGTTSYDTLGIFSVAAISSISTGTTIYTRGQAGEYLTGTFTQLTDHTVEVTCGIAGCTTTALSTGGIFNLWMNSADYNPTQGPTGAGIDLNNGVYNGVSGGSLYLSGVFANGAVLAGDSTSSYLSNFNNGSFAGNGQGFLDVTGGSHASMFDTNTLIDANGNARDMFMTVTFDNVNNAASQYGWTVKSAGQISANVPEPGSLALTALALLGAAGVLRRRSSKK